MDGFGLGKDHESDRSDELLGKMKAVYIAFACVQ